MVQLSDRARGVAIAAAGVLCVTPDAVLLRWAQTQGANTSSILFWKFFFVFWFTCAWVFYVEKKSAPPEGVIKSLYERIKHLARSAVPPRPRSASGPSLFSHIEIL